MPTCLSCHVVCTCWHAWVWLCAFNPRGVQNTAGTCQMTDQYNHQINDLSTHTHFLKTVKFNCDLPSPGILTSTNMLAKTTHCLTTANFNGEPPQATHLLVLKTFFAMVLNFNGGFCGGTASSFAKQLLSGNGRKPKTMKKAANLLG